MSVMERLRKKLLRKAKLLAPECTLEIRVTNTTNVVVTTTLVEDHSSKETAYLLVPGDVLQLTGLYSKVVIND